MWDARNRGIADDAGAQLPDELREQHDHVQQGEAVLDRILRHTEPPGTHADKKVPGEGGRVVAHHPRSKGIVIGRETVRVYSKAEEAEAPQIIARIRDKYGIEISSVVTVVAIKLQYGQVPDHVKDGLRPMEWELKELRALEAALGHYGPVLGEVRKQSTKKSADQEVQTIGKVSQAIDLNHAHGKLDKSTMGEYFESQKSFGMFRAGTDSTLDFSANAKQIEGTVVHELAHGMFADQYDAFVATGSGGYWIDRFTASGDKAAEAPPTDYGRKNAMEDLAESVMFFFVDEAMLKNRCPLRHAFIRRVIDGWSAKPGSGEPGAARSP